MAITRGKRSHVFERDAGRCRYCGDVGDTLDHVIPRALGGSDDLGNLVCCCSLCNQYKGDRLMGVLGMSLLDCGTVKSPEIAAFIRHKFERLARLSAGSRKREMKRGHIEPAIKPRSQNKTIKKLLQEAEVAAQNPDNLHDGFMPSPTRRAT